MVQTRFKKKANQEENLDKLRDQYRKEDITVSHRIVTLKYKSCCGCGCSYSDIKRTVPSDSELQDGDITEDYEPDDEMI